MGGSYLLSSGGCARCTAGTYSAASGLSCAPCPEGATSLAGSATAAACTAPCSAGAYLAASGCQACPANTYSAAGATACAACRPLFQSPAGSAACAPPPNAALMSSFPSTSSSSRPAVPDDAVSLSAAEPALTVFSQASTAYATYTSYYITLQPPPGGYAVVITFLSIATESCCDSVRVWSNASLTGTQLGGSWSGDLSGSELPEPIQAPAGWSPSVLFYSDSSVTSTGIAFTASLVCADAACAAAPPQPSAPPLPSPSSTPNPGALAPGGGGGGGGGSFGGGLGGIGAGGGGGGSVAAAGALDSGSAAGVAVGVVLMLLFVAVAGALIYRHSQAQLVGKLAGWGGAGGEGVVVSSNPMASALGAAQPRLQHGPRAMGAGGGALGAQARPPPGPPPRGVASSGTSV